MLPCFLKGKAFKPGCVKRYAGQVPAPAGFPLCFSPYMPALGLPSFPVTAYPGVEQLLTSRFQFTRSDVNFYIKYSCIWANRPVLPL